MLREVGRGPGAGAAFSEGWWTVSRKAERGMTGERVRHGGRSIDGHAVRGIASDVEPEVHDVAFADDVFLAFQAQLAGFLAALFAFVGDVVLVGDDLGADEAFFEVGVDHAGGLRGGGADLYGP